MFFWIVTHTPPPYLGILFFGGGKNHFAYCGRPVGIRTWVLKNFFFYMDPLTHGGGPGSKLLVHVVADPPPPPIWPLANEDLSGFMMGGLFSGT